MGKKRPHRPPLSKEKQAERHAFMVKRFREGVSMNEIKKEAAKFGTVPSHEVLKRAREDANSRKRFPTSANGNGSGAKAAQLQAILAPEIEMPEKLKKLLERVHVEMQRNSLDSIFVSADGKVQVQKTQRMGITL